ncbi:MAG TPA: hypothetical protein VHX12_11585, partial [Acidisoma sp.]|nr:hypothetical protein [Acidisoma sp.]
LALCLVAFGTAAEASAAVRSRGSIVSISPQQIVVDDRGGETMSFAITPQTGYAAVKALALSAIQPGSYIGSAAVPAPGGILRALEVTVFPPNMNGVGEGHYAWDLTSESSMTNGTVGDLKRTNGDLLTVTYNGGEQKILVPSGTPIVTVGPGSYAALHPGIKVIVFAEMHAPKTAARIIYGENGLMPPQ